MNGVTCGDKGEKIISRFDGDVRVLCRIKAKQEGPWTKYEQLGRVYDVVKYGTRFYLEQNSIFAMEIASPQNIEADIGVDWEKCQ